MSILGRLNGYFNHIIFHSENTCTQFSAVSALACGLWVYPLPDTDSPLQRCGAHLFGPNRRSIWTAEDRNEHRSIMRLHYWQRFVSAIRFRLLPVVAQGLLPA